MEQSHYVQSKDNISTAVTDDIEQCLNGFEDVWKNLWVKWPWMAVRGGPLRPPERE